jgi:hypothetical protein
MFASRQRHSRLRGAKAAACTDSGSQVIGPDTATSDIATRHFPAVSLNRKVTSASVAGLTRAKRTSSWLRTHVSTMVSSLITAGHAPIECKIRVPGNGHFLLTARVRLFPTTQLE